MELHSGDFEGKRLKNNGTLPVLFYAKWCPFCRSFYPQFEKAVEGNGVEWAEVDISDYDDPLWENFEINAVPTVIVFRNGEPTFRRDGVLGNGLSAKALGEILQEMKDLRN